MSNGVATYHEMDGRPAAATEARLDCLEMGVMMPRGGTLIAGLVGLACESIAFSGIESQLPLLSEKELAHTAARLDRIAGKRISYADVLQEEGYVQTASDLAMLKDPKGYRSFDTVRDLLSEDDGTGTGNKKPLTLAQNWEALRFAFADKAAMVRANQAYNAALVAEARTQYKAASTVPVPNNFLANIRGGFTDTARSRFVTLEAVQAVLRTEVAVYRYKKAHGSLPDRLSALTPTFLPRKAMVDPFTGAMLHYAIVPGGKGFSLYSVGPDMKDNRGVPKSPGNGTGDIVAGKLWPNHRAFKK